MLADTTNRLEVHLDRDKLVEQRLKPRGVDRASRALIASTSHSPHFGPIAGSRLCGGEHRRNATALGRGHRAPILGVAQSLIAPGSTPRKTPPSGASSMYRLS